MNEKNITEPADGLRGRPKARKEMDQLKARIKELEAMVAEPGPWLTGEELKTIMPTLKEGDVVGVRTNWLGEFNGALMSAVYGDGLYLARRHVRNWDGSVGDDIQALRVIERAPEPEPGADIPDEVVKAATFAYEAMRAALAAADAKRAELEG